MQFFFFKNWLVAKLKSFIEEVEFFPKATDELLYTFPALNLDLSASFQ